MQILDNKHDVTTININSESVKYGNESIIFNLTKFSSNHENQ